MLRDDDIVLNSELMPKHIAIIMDGNGRWATKRGLPRTAGHKVGSERIFDLVSAAKSLRIEALTIFAFSTENWKRDKKEVNYIFSLLEDGFVKKLDKLKKENVKITVSGNLNKLTGTYDSLKEKIEKVIDETKNNDAITLNVAFNYGGHDEIVMATKNISMDVQKGKINIDDIDETLFESYLTTSGLPSVDLMIRTSGEQRLSNFLLWQLAYSEFVFTNVMWPDFDKKELENAIVEYNRRKRNFGK